MNLKVAAVISVFVLIGGVLTFSQSSDFISDTGPIQPCQQPLTYNFGTIDSRFNITKTQLAEIMKEVEALWATALQKDLLDYDKQGRVSIHLVYSDDQKRTEQERSFSKKIEFKRSKIEILKQEYEQYKERFEEKRDDFRSTVDEYNSSIESYNDFAKKWSGKNPSLQAQNRFERMEQTISRLESEVNQKQQDLESLRRQTNAKSRELNSLVDEQNQMIADYNTRFSISKKFDQGRYSRQGQDEKINIFQFANHAQLKTVLAHEVGHAFGLAHVGNPESIMNEMMDEQNIFNLQLTDEDIASIKKLCSK